MLPYFSDYYGNPFSLHLFGTETGKAVADARKKIADILRAKPSEIIFTASGSESDNLAVRGIARAYKHRGKHIITSSIEHPAVKDTFVDLMEDGFEVSVIPVDENGVLVLDELKKALREDTILISVMHANNEVGSFQPIEEIAKIAKERKIIFHVDAVQSMGKVEIYPEKMGIDLLSFSGHKFYAPKGVAVLYKRDGVRLGKVITGGNQEGKRRPGTSNTPYIVGIATALFSWSCSRPSETPGIVVDAWRSWCWSYFAPGSATRRPASLVSALRNSCCSSGSLRVSSIRLCSSSLASSSRPSSDKRLTRCTHSLTSSSSRSS